MVGARGKLIIDRASRARAHPPIKYVYVLSRGPLMARYEANFASGRAGTEGLGITSNFAAGRLMRARSCASYGASFAARFVRLFRFMAES